MGRVIVGLNVLLSSTPPGSEPTAVNVLILPVYFGGLIHAFAHRRRMRVRFSEVPALQALDTVPEPVLPNAAALPAAAAPPSNAVRTGEPRPWSDKWTRKKLCIDRDEDWSAARIIPIVPCNEAADSDDEVTRHGPKRTQHVT